MTVRVRELLFLLVLVLVALGLRFYDLRLAPALFTHDELHYISEAQSLVVSGSDLTGTWKPWHFRPTSPLYAELPSTVMMLGSLLFQDVFLKARFVHIVLGVLLPIVLGGIGWNLTQRKRVFWLTVGVGLLNPWLFQFSRMSFDALLSLFFYSLGVLGLLSLSAKWRWTAFLAFVLGFFQYQGLKLIFLPLIFLTTGFIFWRDFPAKITGKLLVLFEHVRKNQLDLLLIVALSVVVFGWFLTQLPTQSASSRVNDILFFNNKLLSQKVNEQRLLSLEDPFGKLAVNKVSVITHEFLIKYAQTFDPSQLFVRGESVRNPFSVWTRGMFYPIDIVLLGSGVFTLIIEKKLRKQLLLLLGFVLISPLPVAVNSIDTWVMFRGSWLIVSFILLMGIGLDALVRWLSKGWLKIVLAVFILVYILNVLNFFNEYFYRYPVYGTKGTAFAERVVANYIHRLPKEMKVVVLVDEARFVFESYLVYNNLINEDNMPQIQEAMKSSVYRLGNVTFATDCLDVEAFADDTVFINNSVNVTCDQKPVPSLNQPYSKIPSLLDNGAQFTIYNDLICSKYALRPFVHVTNRRILDAERLDNQQFCDELFSKPIE